jgi:hypothetical protein
MSKIGRDGVSGFHPDRDCFVRVKKCAWLPFSSWFGVVHSSCRENLQAGCPSHAREHVCEVLAINVAVVDFRLWQQERQLAFDRKSTPDHEKRP